MAGLSDRQRQINDQQLVRKVSAGVSEIVPSTRYNSKQPQDAKRCGTRLTALFNTVLPKHKCVCPS
jgi:hypothetical protein